MNVEHIALSDLPRWLLGVGCRVRTAEVLHRDDELVDRAAHALKAALDEISLLRTALRFYAHGEHYHLDDSEDFDTVSGEPQNWLCSGREDSSTMVEIGQVAIAALQGVVLHWIDGDDDHTPQPIEGEVSLVIEASAMNTPAPSSQQVLKAEAARPDATARECTAITSPGGGPTGAGQPAAAGPIGGSRKEAPKCQ